MKKLFFFRSNSSSNGEKDNAFSPEPDRAKPDKQEEFYDNNPRLRRSHSFSSGIEKGRRIEQIGSPYSINSYNPPYPRKNRTPPEMTKADFWETSSNCSSNISNKVLDRYIDGEEQHNGGNSEHFLMNNKGDGVVKRRPPRNQCSAPPDARNHHRHTKSQSRSTRLSHSSRELRNDVDFSPRKLARNVVERLSQPQIYQAKESDQDSPITIQDIYNNGGRNFEENYSENIDDALSADGDFELLNKFKEAEDRVAILSEELENQNFVPIRGGVHVPPVLIRNLCEDKLNLSIEVLDLVQNRIADKALFNEEMKQARIRTDSLERELDRRSIELEKYQEEEHRLRDRVHQLAQQNVTLESQILSFTERETDIRTKITNSEKELEELACQVKEGREENQLLKENVSELENKYRVAEKDRDCFKKKYEEKEIECKDLYQSISRLQQMCSDQEKTIDGLRGSCDENEKQNNREPWLEKVQMEQIRLTGVEYSLRKEIESYRMEVDSLHHENMDLLNRLKKNGSDGKEEGGVFLQLDRELQSRVNYLQDQGVSLVVESSEVCGELLEFIKSTLKRGPAFSDPVVDFEVRFHSLEIEVESFKSGMRTVSNVLQHEKSMVFGVMEFRPSDLGQGDEKSEDVLRSELKAQTLLTRLLHEKLYSKELETEKIKAELAAAVRANDVLKCGMQNESDNFSRAHHKYREAQMQILKKDEAMNLLQNNFQDCKKELSAIKSLLTKLTEERDDMWEKVKQYSEETMLLNSEIAGLKKKIEALDEEILIKDGQMAILQDDMAKPFDFLATDADDFLSRGR